MHGLRRGRWRAGHEDILGNDTLCMYVCMIIPYVILTTIFLDTRAFKVVNYSLSELLYTCPLRIGDSEMRISRRLEGGLDQRRGRRDRMCDRPTDLALVSMV